MKRIHRKLLLILLTVIFTAAFTACNKDTQTGSKKKVTTIPTNESEITIEADKTFEIPTEPMKIRDLSGQDIVKEITIGWNLGNTMDANGATGVDCETSWGNPKTTQKMIDMVKNAGFNTIRIPITWQPHIGAAPDYIIDKAWLDRVQEIVDYAYEDNLYVIINMHHDDWYCPYYKTEDTAIDELKKTWKQIADCFENYDEHLIFEDLNEPRQKGTSFEWNGGNEEGRDVVNKLNAAFVETIRNAGGNNPLRILMIPPYAANSSPITWNDFKIPNDNKIIVSIHAYTPYNFALNKTGTSEWSASNANDTMEIDNLMKNLNDYFISKGIPVIIGEFGAVNKFNTDKRVAWADYYVSKAKEKGIPCIWWDNGSFAGNGELFGLLDRYNLRWDQKMVDALMQGLKDN